MQLGNVTEVFNAYWYELKTGIAVDRRVKDKAKVHPVHAFMRANLDGLVVIDGTRMVWDAKHTNAFGSQEDVVSTYFPQMQHNMEVTGLDHAEISVFYGNSAWRKWSIARDPDYIAELIQRETEFWRYVEGDTPPPSDGIEAIKVEFEQLRTVDMSRNNMWCDLEATWIKFREAASSHKSAEAGLKGMVEADVGFAFGAELVCVRDRGGKLSLREPKKTDARRKEEYLSKQEPTE